MPESLTGRLHGNVITLDSPLHFPEGQLVRVVIEPIAGDEVELDSGTQARLWQEWIDRGPQGPIEDHEEELRD
ncbi:MAG TPA: hypothetical protein VEP28_13650 [Rubrobacter sp.]|nr:hypothetical protein [Rubrobacter sp.]